jgi:hypothetical protein
MVPNAGTFGPVKPASAVVIPYLLKAQRLQTISVNSGRDFGIANISKVFVANAHERDANDRDVRMSVVRIAEAKWTTIAEHYASFFPGPPRWPPYFVLNILYIVSNVKYDFEVSFWSQ